MEKQLDRKENLTGYLAGNKTKGIQAQKDHVMLRCLQDHTPGCRAGQNLPYHSTATKKLHYRNRNDAPCVFFVALQGIKKKFKKNY